VTERVGEWTLPDGLNRSRPREVSLTAMGRGLVFAIVALWVGAVGAWVGLDLAVARGAEEQRLLREQGVDATAEVTRLWRTRGEKRHHWVAYRFEAGGQVIERNVKLPPSAWSALAVGRPLAIRYVRSKPELSFTNGERPDAPPAFLPHLVGGLLAAFACLAPLPLVAQRRLLAEGRPAQGQVTRHTKDQHGTKVHYEFRTLGGSRAKGKAGPTRKPAPIGGSVCVLYQPDQPGSNSLYPLSLVRLVDTRRLGLRTG
jgi:hypothetical protein